MLLESPAWMEPDLCALEEWSTFRSPLVQLIATGAGQRTVVVCGLSEAWRRKLDRDLKAQMSERRSVPAPPQLLSPEAELSLETVPDLLKERLQASPDDPERGLYFVHEMSWTAERYSVDQVLEYLGRMARLRREHAVQMVHIYSPTAFTPSAQWRLMRGHRAIWTGESTCDNFYYSPRSQPPPPAEFNYADDLQRNLEHLKRQSRIRAELVGTVVQTESLVEERVRELQALNRLAQILAHSQDLDEILHEALVRVLELLEMEAGAIYISREPHEETEQRVAIVTPAVTRDALRVFHKRAVQAVDVPQAGRISWASDLRESPGASVPPDLGIRSYLTAPLKFSGDVVGLLEVVSREAHAFSLQEIHMVDVIGGQIGVAVENARLYQQREASRTAEQQLRGQLFASERLVSLGRLVSRIAHEVEKPIESILQATRELERESGGQRGRPALDIIAREARHAADVLAGLRTLVGETHAELEWVDLNQVLSACLDRHQEELKADAVQVATHLDATRPRLSGDRFQLEQTFLNLIENARQVLQNQPGEKHLKLSTKQQAGNIVVVVEDDGPGIPAEDLLSVFEPFFTTRASGRGAGLGLAICRAIVQAHGGAIQVSSSPGRTAFTLTFPTASSDSPKTRSPVAPDAGKRSTRPRRGTDRH